MKFKASENLAVQIAEWLSDRIVHLELKPGSRIVEAKLAEELGVSRSPVREALRMLADNGLVELLPRRGARVTEMTPESIFWLNDVLKELLGLISRQAAINRTPETLKPITASVRDMEDCAAREDVSGFLECIIRFGLSSCRAGGNQILEGLITYIWPVTRRYMYASLCCRRASSRTTPGSSSCSCAATGRATPTTPSWSSGSWWSTTSASP